MPTNDAMTPLLERLKQNALPLQQSYANANELLNVAIRGAFPWVLSLPAVRGKVPTMFRNALPKGAPVTLDKLETLATQLVAILAASYGTPGPEPNAGEASRPRQAATIHTFKE